MTSAKAGGDATLRRMAEGSAAQSRPAGEGALVCPACGKAIDPLRAGQVAILEGRFHYYCDEACKRGHLRGREGAPAVDAVTAEPPPVAVRHVAIRPEPLQSPSEEAAPSTLRSPEQRVQSSAPSSPTSATRPIASPPRPATRRFASIVGVVAGVLAPGLALLGPGADAVRLPLAALAVTIHVLRPLAAPGDPSDAPAFALVLPAAVGLLAAVIARASGNPHALALASFAALAAAASLVVDMLVEGAREGLAAERQRIGRALDVEVRVLRKEEGELIPADAVKPGEQVVVHAGETIGVDAVVNAGDAVVRPWLDTSIEVPVREGDPIVAGAKVVSGRLRLTTTWAGQDRAWVRLALVSGLRADVAAPLTRLARLLVTRAAPAAALVVALAAYAGNASGAEVLAAACAAALAVGGRGVVAVVALHHARAQLDALGHGIVYKDASALDEAGRASVAVLCARGTVLMGEPEIVALESLGSIEVATVLSLTAGAETVSTHPFAAAILRTASARGVRPENVRSATVHAGLGVTALTAVGERLVVGSRALLLEERVSIAMADARVSELEAQGRSVLLVALGGKLAGLLALQDGLRPGARAAVQRLLDAHLEPVLLSGEARETCETIGRALDIDHVRPEVLPAERGNEVRALGEGGHLVAVLGHPATDDGALGASDVSIAMHASGATPGEWSVTLASDDVRDAARALGIAHDMRERAKIALALGLCPGVAAALVIAFGVAPLTVAPLALLAGTVAALMHAKV